MPTTAATNRAVLKRRQSQADVFHKQHADTEGNPVYLQIHIQEDVVHLYAAYILSSWIPQGYCVDT